MLLSPSRPLALLLQPALRRSFTTCRYCLRKRTPLLKQRSRERNEPRIRLPTRPQLLLSGNANTDLQSFLTTVRLRVENLLYAADARSETRSESLAEREFENIVFQFRDAIMSNLMERLGDGKYSEAPIRVPTPEELHNVYSNYGVRRLDSLIMKHFKRYFMAYAHPSLNETDVCDATAFADMRNPGEWFPIARSMRRKIIMHVGPTNSGKTYQALKRLEAAQSGWYGGPLRLLAHEIFNRMNDKGIKCNLKTGEEIRIIDINAPLTSSTIEMFSESASYDVAVIDEIQMIADSGRGYAWSNALLGLKAKEIHLCGEESTIPLISAIAKELGDELEVHKYERLSPLTTQHAPLSSYKNIKPGDCVVSFSRKSLFLIKEQIEREKGLKCALIYGALPPETRAMQADLFNDPTSGYDVLVASDAVGMGLNLNIKRVIFETLEKREGDSLKELLPPQIKQIAGRAGRYRVASAASDANFADGVGGTVTALRHGQMALLHRSIATPNADLKYAMLWPPFRVFERFTHNFQEGTPLTAMISRFMELSETSDHYRAIESDSQIALANLIDHIPDIDLESRYNISFAPVKYTSKEQSDAFVKFATAFSEGQPVTIESPALEIPLEYINKMARKIEAPCAMTAEKLRYLEQIHKIITCYCWLSVRWPALYADYPLALKWREKAERVIHQGLMKVNNPLSSGDKQQAESPTIPRLELGYPTSERIAAV